MSIRLGERAACFMLAVLWSGTGALAQQSIDRSVEASAEGAVRVELVEGDITLTGWDQPRIQVSGQLGSVAQRLEIEQQGDEVLIRIVEPDADAGPRAATDIFVSLPRSSRVRVNGTNVDILVANVDGELSLQSVGGDIEVESNGSAIEAGTVGGDIRVLGRGTRSEAKLTTVAGEIEVGGSFAQLEASTVSGDIELDLLDVVSLSLNATNGDIEVHATFDGAAELTAETMNGDVELEVGEVGELNIDAGTFSGRIETCFDRDGDATERDRQRDGGDGNRRDRRRGPRQGGGELQLTADPDAPRIRVRTLNGDIEICSA